MHSINFVIKGNFLITACYLCCIILAQRVLQGGGSIKWGNDQKLDNQEENDFAIHIKYNADLN